MAPVYSFLHLVSLVWTLEIAASANNSRISVSTHDPSAGPQTQVDVLTGNRHSKLPLLQTGVPTSPQPRSRAASPPQGLAHRSSGSRGPLRASKPRSTWRWPRGAASEGASGVLVSAVTLPLEQPSSLQEYRQEVRRTGEVTSRAKAGPCTCPDPGRRSPPPELDFPGHEKDGLAPAPSSHSEEEGLRRLPGPRVLLRRRHA